MLQTLSCVMQKPPHACYTARTMCVTPHPVLSTACMIGTVGETTRRADAESCGADTERLCSNEHGPRSSSTPSSDTPRNDVILHAAVRIIPP